MFHMCGVTHSYYVPKKKVRPVYLHTMCDVACSYVWHDSFTCMAFQLQCIRWSGVHSNYTAFLHCITSAVQCEMHSTWSAFFQCMMHVCDKLQVQCIPCVLHSNYTVFLHSITSEVQCEMHSIWSFKCLLSEHDACVWYIQSAVHSVCVIHSMCMLHCSYTAFLLSITSAMQCEIHSNCTTLLWWRSSVSLIPLIHNSVWRVCILLCILQVQVYVK